MSKLLMIVIPSLILAALAEYNSVYKVGLLGEKKYVHKDKFFFVIMAVSMAVFVGLRTNYNDTTAYTHAYRLIEDGKGVFSGLDWSLGENPGFNLLNRCLHALGLSEQSFLMVYAVVTICIYVWFIRKYSNNIWLSIFFFFTMGCYTFTMAAIKQTVAVAFCLIATDFAIRKKWPAFIVCVILAATFHPYSLMYFIAPFLMFNPWTPKTYFMLAIFGIAGVGLQSMLGTIISITSMLGEEYTAASFSGDGVNVLRLAVVWVPVVLSFLTRDFMRQNNDRASNLIMNFSMLNAEIMFIALFGTANYFARLANYFLIFQTISLPWLFKYYTRESKQLLLIGAVAGYSLYYIYAEGMLYGGFDLLFKGITLLDYIQSLL